MTGTVMNQLDPSHFGPVSSPHLSILPFDHHVNSVLGGEFDSASLISHYYGDGGILCVVSRNRTFIDSPINPLYGLPEYVERFAFHANERPTPVTTDGLIENHPVIVIQNPNSSWDCPSVPHLAIYDKVSKVYKTFPLPYRINDTKLEGESAIELYELLTATGSASSGVRKHTHPDVTVISDDAGGSKTTNQTPIPGYTGPSNRSAAASEYNRVQKAPAVRQKRHGVTIMKSTGVKVATRRTNTGEIEISRAHGLVWAGPFADCPPKDRKKWSNDLRILTWLSGERNPTVTAKMSIRKVWFRPLKKYQDELNLPIPDNLTISGEYVLDSYDKNNFDWTLGES